ncbi:GmrSD restriction endonuclease domain-containing protein [Streptomyces decoyicus]|uniref:GmrSD restriction endonuclease domain-containing protein n=1 Tax=Streptomyces decoyicus TaxID=249567 RepID=UPI00099CB311
MGSSQVVEARVRAPEPTIAPIASLAQRVLSGDVVLPKFQRGFVWTPEQVLYLLDSVRRNYPVGSLLMWRTTANLASGHEIAGLNTVPQHEGAPVHYVLDGQQRLASLVGALHGSGPLWDIAYDLEKEEFLHLSEATPAGPHIMPIRHVNSVGAMLAWVRKHSPDLRLQSRAEALSNQFNHYQVPVVTLLDVSEEDSARIFERINSTGTTMDIVDLVRAGTWARDFDLKEEIEQLLQVLDAKKYGRVDAKTMLRTISAASGLGFSTKDIHRLRQLDAQCLREAVSEAGKAAERAVDFLYTQIRTPKAEALPYYNQFAVLVEVFRQLPKPTTAQYDAVARWFWLTASGEYFKGWRESQMGPDLQAVTAFAEGRTQEIETGAALPRSVLWQRSPFSRQSAPSKLLVLLLSYEDPIDLNTGRRIDVGKALSWQNDKQFHHFFPRAWLRNQGVSAARANACGNLIMLTALSNNWISDRAPSRYLKDLAELNGEDALRARLRSCLVEEDAYQAALRDDYDAFLRARSEALHRRLKGLIGSAAEGSGIGQAEGVTLEELVMDSAPDDGPVDRDSVD